MGCPTRPVMQFSRLACVISQLLHISLSPRFRAFAVTTFHQEGLILWAGSVVLMGMQQSQALQTRSFRIRQQTSAVPSWSCLIRLGPLSWSLIPWKSIRAKLRRWTAPWGAETESWVVNSTICDQQYLVCCRQVLYRQTVPQLAWLGT